jgi:hypothetical protein
MKVQIEIGGKVEDVDLDIGTLTLREAVTVQKAIGDTKWDQLGVEGSMVRPDVVQALVFAKLHHRYPDLTIEDFDFEMGDIETETDPT